MKLKKIFRVKHCRDWTKNEWYSKKGRFKRHATNIINNILSFDNEFNVDRFNENDCKRYCLNVLYPMLIKNYYYIKKYYKHAVEYEGNNSETRCGQDTYGYYSYQHIMERINYISDRYNSTFRLKWLLDLIPYLESELKILSKLD